ncbi:heat stress transcription factor C-1, putative [Entamoeba dispar SAW760]|uniref:Heat stress transcription factor C-1, putative n=1 Tax=Entamoeba dispar (strain ATCC PRA-260 / SAW760) TaxID=370354 RepID=B0E908_ENTDS|nr:heat stress transcription factor C-1, putative [Entamoeba dispar SAW760]EDR28981.1 heat stress transcription factor C-1, putative [Entamoeba dispar SAW760]|eukprot:EDR28981.1 heat stress transcription factor C-1, putative [Entamoeba dispar SAW760]
MTDYEKLIQLSTCNETHNPFTPLIDSKIGISNITNFSNSVDLPIDKTFEIKKEEDKCEDKQSAMVFDVLHNCTPFISKLYSLVNTPEYHSLIQWSEEHKGKAFIITDPVQFAKEVLPYHFKHSNISSFVRQLNIYGFHKLEYKTGICFKHEFFVRDAPEFLDKIKRKKNKKLVIPSSLHQSNDNTDVCKMFSLRMDMTRIEKDLLEVRHEIQNNLVRWSDLKNRLDQIEMFLPMLLQVNQFPQQPTQQNEFVRRYQSLDDSQRTDVHH